MENFNLTVLKDFTDSFFSQTYSFDVQAVCRAPNSRIDGSTLEDACKIEWNPNGTVRSYGPIQHGEFEGNPDIAGLGLLIYFAIGPFVCIFGSGFSLWEFFFKRRVFETVEDRFQTDPEQPRYIHWLAGLREPSADQGRVVKALRALLKATADALTVIALSYVLNFGISGKCTISGYHYLFGINTMLIAFASITLYVAIVRDFWAAPFAALFRTFAHVVIFSLIGRILFYEWTVGIMPEPIYYWSKVEETTDSALFLPMACFLDHTLNPLVKLNSAQLERIGYWDSPKKLVEPIAFILLSLCFVLAHMAHLAQAKHRYFSTDEEASGKLWGGHKYAKGAKWFWLFIVVVCTLANGFCYGHILVLRQWILASGWMEDVPGSQQSDEDDLFGIGQLGYLCTFIWIGLLVLDEIRCCGRSRKN